jgi:hypothetical protein
MVRLRWVISLVTAKKGMMPLLREINITFDSQKKTNKV